MKRFFITGISTDVGKTIASAIITEALRADYWKPVQAGDQDDPDDQKVKRLVSNPETVIHPNSYRLNSPMSPHAAASLDGIEISLTQISEPETNNHLVIEGAGGLLVPLNDRETIMDLIQPHYKVVVVSRHYLGSINHTLLTLGWLQLRGYSPAILFSGDEHPSTESIILRKTGVQCIGRIGEEAVFDKLVVKAYARSFRQVLESL